MIKELSKAKAQLRVIEGGEASVQAPTLQHWIDDFLVTKRWQWRPATLKAYTSVLGLYAAHVGDDHWPPTRQGVLHWLARVGETNSQTTVHTYWTHLRAFFNYLELVEALTPRQNPARQIRDLRLAPDNPDLLPVAFPPEELVRLFDYLETQAQTGDRMATRDLALIRFAYVTGCREGEIARLTLDFLEMHNYKAIILAETSKGKKPRPVYFDDDVHRNLQDWLTIRPMVPSVREVFVSLGGRLGVGHPILPRALYAILHRRCQAAGVPCRKFHALRHTSALDALEEGIDPRKVQAQLGHASLETTMRYLRGRDEDRAWAYRNRSLSSGLSQRAERRQQGMPQACGSGDKTAK